MHFWVLLPHGETLQPTVRFCQGRQSEVYLPHTDVAVDTLRDHLHLALRLLLAISPNRLN